MKLVYVLSFLFGIFNSATAQNSPVKFSRKIDISESGWSKTLMLKNGNTAMLYIQRRQAITMFIFDSLGRQIARNGELSAYINIGLLPGTYIKGFYEINGQPTLFVEQLIDNKMGLVRISFNSRTGKVAEEKLVDKAANAGDGRTYCVKLSPSGNYYAVARFGNDVSWQSGFTVATWNSKHEELKYASVDYGSFIGMHVDDDDDVFVALSRYTDTSDEHYAMYGIMKQKADSFSFGTIECKVYRPVLASFYEDGGQLCSLLLTDGVIKPQLQDELSLVFGITMDIDKEDGSLYNIKKLAHSYCTEIKPTTITGVEKFNSYVGVPLSIIQIDSTKMLVSENTWESHDHLGHYIPVTEFNNVCVTGLDRAGAERFGNLISINQFVKNHIHVNQLFKRQTEKKLFTTSDGQSFLDQLVGCDSRKLGSYCLIIQNESLPGDTEDEAKMMINYRKKAAAFYRINNKGVVKKEFLLGSPLKGVFRSALIESTSYDLVRNKLALVVADTKEKKTAFKIAWVDFSKMQ